MPDKRTKWRPSVDFAVLGGLRVTVNGVPVNVGPRKQRLVLGMLVCRVNRIVRVEALSEALWADHPPRTARKNLQAYVATLRRAIGDRIDYVAAGYVLRADRQEVDVERFEMLAAAARHVLRGGDHVSAVPLLDSAVRCWQGPPLAEFLDTPAVAREAERLAIRFVAIYEDWTEALSELGHDVEILDGIEDVIDDHPFRERLGVVKMIALARCGRTTEALAYYDCVRQRMAREFGLQPSPVLAGVYQRILAGHLGVLGATPDRAAHGAVAADRAHRPARHDGARRLATGGAPG